MSIINSQPLIGASGNQGYNIQRSLRFRSSASAYLNKTFASNGTRTKGTYSTWFKIGTLPSTVTIPLFGCGDTASDSDTSFIAFYPTFGTGVAGTLALVARYGGGTVYKLFTSAVFRDPSAWYHIVVSWDTTLATPSGKIYINGVEQSYGTNTWGTQPQNQNTYFSSSAYPSVIGKGANNADSAKYADGYMAEINFIDGQALTPSSFGQTDSATGVWQPAKYTGTYGTNGFYLPFTDTTSTTTISEDFSGNNNDWTSNNISLTAGSTYDSMKDVPTLTDTDTANYCVLNPLVTPATTTIINGNLGLSGYTAYSSATGTMGVSSGKWYFEFIAQANAMSGITGTPNGSYYPGQASNAYAWDSFAPTKYNNNSGASYGSATVAGDIVGVAFDLDSGSITFYKNNVSQGTAYTFTPSGTYFPVVRNGDTTNTSVNFGQRPFTYTPPSGFVALNTFNLPTPTIGATASSQAGKYMNTVLYSGNDTNRTITGVGFQPDFVWIKGRNAARFHNLFDAVRGAGYDLRSNSTNAEVYDNDTLTAFASDGFSLGTDVTSGRAVNYTGDTYAAWNWKANGSGSTNTAGSITSTVSANTTAGFSIATFTTPSGYSTGTVGHGLGVTPSMIIVKNRTAPSGANNWNIFHTSIGNTGALYLNTTGATTTSSSFWNDTSPTSSVFTIGSNLYASTDYVAYCFAQVAGYSAFGSYTGNGSSDGAFVFTGFRPRFIMIKRSDAGAVNWYIFDTARDTYNAAGLELYPNLSNAEADGRPDLDILSNGFKIRSTSGGQNTNGGTYIYMAVAENPFKYSLAR